MGEVCFITMVKSLKSGVCMAHDVFLNKGEAEQWVNEESSRLCADLNNKGLTVSRECESADFCKLVDHTGGSSEPIYHIMLHWSHLRR